MDAAEVDVGASRAAATSRTDQPTTSYVLTVGPAADAAVAMVMSEVGAGEAEKENLRNRNI